MLIQKISAKLSVPNIDKSKNFKRIEILLRELNDLNEDKVNISQKISRLISNKHTMIEELLDQNQDGFQVPFAKTSSEEKIPEPVFAKPATPPPLPIQNISLKIAVVKAKRGRKKKPDNVKAVKLQNRHKRVESIFREYLLPVKKDSANLVSTTLPPVQLAVNQNGEPVRKVPVTKRAGFRRRRKNDSHNNNPTLEIPDVSEIPDEADENEPLFCICNRISWGPMVMCDNTDCSLEWLHFKCAGLTKPPKGRWFCPRCRSKKSSKLIKKDLVM